MARRMTVLFALLLGLLVAGCGTGADWLVFDATSDDDDASDDDDDATSDDDDASGDDDDATGDDDDASDDDDDATGDDDDASDDDDDATGDDDDASDDDWSGYIWADDEDVCFSEDGFNSIYRNARAYMVGYGGELDWAFDSDFRVAPNDDAFCFDTSDWMVDCYEVTLVSAIRANGNAATNIDNTGDWWDNFAFCQSDSGLADDWCASQGGGNYLVAFCVTNGGDVVPDGDDY